MPDIFGSMFQSAYDPSRFPLGSNATAQEVVMFVDAIALKVFSKGYWQLSWSTTTFNLAIFFCVAIAMRFYRSRKGHVPLWLFKLERRHYRTKPKRKPASQTCPTTRPNPSQSNAAGQSLSLVHAQDEHVPAEQRDGFRARFATICRRFTASETSTAAPADTQDVEVRTGWFITASCVNCHLVLTSSYVVVLFLKVTESFATRDASQPPPLLDPGILEAFMYAAIFSTAYFAALGYIAILVPDTSPWVWNGHIIVSYVVTMIFGLVSISKFAISASKINSYRHMIYNEMFFLPSTDGPLGARAQETRQPATTVVLELAKVAFQESFIHRFWLQRAHGLVAVGGIMLCIEYLIILVALSRKVALELVQIRRVPPPVAAAPAKTRSVTTWPSTAVPFTLSPSPSQPSDPLLPTFLAQQPRMNAPSTTTDRAPPPTTAPNGAFPLSPIGEEDQCSHSSTPELAAYSVNEAHDNPHAMFPQKPSVTTADAVENHANSSSNHTEPVKRCFPAVPKDSEATLQAQDCLESATSPMVSPAHSALEFGPRTRVDSQPTPWDANTLHDDLDTNEGYVAICRFLFNCVIDHATVMLQCCAFGCTSIYLTIVYSIDYPYDARGASLKAARINMVFSCMFTLLYLLDSLNLFAPFLLFPASQVKLATMLTNLYSSGAPCPYDGDDGRVGSSRRKLRMKRKKAQGDAACRGETSREAWKFSSRLKGKDSSKNLLSLAGKVTSETYSSHSPHKSTSTTTTTTSSIPAAVDESIVNVTASIHTADKLVAERHHPASPKGLQYPPIGSTIAPTSPSAETHKIEWDASENVSAPSSDRGHAEVSAGRLVPQVAASTKMFPNTLPDDVGSDSPSIRHGTSKKDSPSPKHGAGPFANVSGECGGVSTSNTMADQARDKAHGCDGVAGVCTSKWKSPSFSTTDKSSKTEPTDCGTKNLAWRLQTSQPVPPHSPTDGPVLESPIGVESNSSFVTCDSSAGSKPKGRQLVLDSLISSHALPIQGFYCQSTAFGATSTLRLYHSDQSIESGIAMSRFEEDARGLGSSAGRRRFRSRWEQKQRHDLAYDTEDELRPGVSDSERDNPMTMGKTAKTRLPRLLPQFASHKKLRHPAESSTSSSPQYPLSKPHPYTVETDPARASKRRSRLSLLPTQIIEPPFIIATEAPRRNGIDRPITTAPPSPPMVGNPTPISTPIQPTKER